MQEFSIDSNPNSWMYAMVTIQVWDGQYLRFPKCDRWHFSLLSNDVQYASFFLFNYPEKNSHNFAGPWNNVCLIRSRFDLCGPSFLLRLYFKMNVSMLHLQLLTNAKTRFLVLKQCFEDAHSDAFLFWDSKHGIRHAFSCPKLQSVYNKHIRSRCL